MVAARRADPNPQFAEAFAQALPSLPGNLVELRQASLASFETLGLPTNRAELWKYTNLPRFIDQPRVRAAAHKLAAGTVADHFAGGPKARRLIFINGHLQVGLSHFGGLPAGVRIEPLDAALANDGAALTPTLKTQTNERSMTALNAALCDHGAVIEVDAGVQFADPVQLLFLNETGDAASMSHPRLIVRLGAGSSMHLIESHIALNDGAALTNIVAHYEIADDAVLTSDRLQLLKGDGTLVSKLHAELGNTAKLDLSTVGLGGTLIRNENEVWIKGSDTDANLNGIYLPRGTEHVDHLIQIHHDAANSRSEQLYKGVMRDRGRAAFQGKIFVHKDAQQTNAYQTNNNLLLSDDAEIDSKPELEIYADDVKCSHGATCGDHDEQALFYLRSRGLNAEAAESVLTFAFLAEVIDRIGDETVRETAKQAVIDRLPGGDLLRDI